MNLPPDNAEVPFLDVGTLLETSEPLATWGVTRMVGIGVLVAMALAWYFLGQSAGSAQLVPAFFTVSMAVLLGTWAAAGAHASRAARREQSQLEATEELIQLRRWPQAAILVQTFLSTPAHSEAARAQGLLFLAMVLARYHRFDDSVAVHEYVLDEIGLDDASQQSVRLGRAMALLRAENLLDADRAIAELRRDSRATGGPSAGLSLLELYRDVKTGHPTEALEIFEQRLPMMRKQLGHRVGDAWALAARAFDLLGRSDEARGAYQNAKMLLPLSELRRRYPEIAVLSEKYSPMPAPVEVVG
jgi:tetratricopeptide (TPR) repeat protein